MSDVAREPARSAAGCVAAAFQRKLLGADARQRRRRLWRYRHQPALRLPRSGGGGGRVRPGDPRHRARRAVDDPVVADRRRHHQIRADAAARRQQRRGRHAVADGAGDPRARPADAARAAARRHRRGDVSRRLGDHAGDLGAVGGRRPEARDAGASSTTSAAHRSSILVALFAVQRRGTARVAAFFGPVMVVWFVAIAVAGAHAHRATIPACSPRSIRSTPSSFVSTHGHIGLITLGAVFLVVTGGEALYADLGHFGRKPIQTRLARPGAAGAADQLFRPGRAGAGAIRRRSKIRSTGWCRSRCCCRWWCWRPPRP